MTEAAERHDDLVARLRESTAVSGRVLDAFERLPRHIFLPDVPLETAYADDAIVTHDEGGVPTSSSTQPSLMARMIELLELQPGDRVLEIGAGTGYNAAVMAELGAAVTTVELQPEVAEAARGHLREAGVLADGGVLVAPLRVNGLEVVLGLRREGRILRGTGAIPCGFMPMRGGDQRPWRWKLGAGGVATADADLGVEGRGALDRLPPPPGQAVDDPLGLADGEHALGALLWLGLQGDPLIALVLPGQGNRPPWTVGLDVLPASLLVIALGPGFDAVASATLHGGDGALRT